MALQDGKAAVGRRGKTRRGWKLSARRLRRIVRVVSSGEVLRAGQRHQHRFDVLHSISSNNNNNNNNNSVTFHADGLARDTNHALPVVNVAVCLKNIGLAQNE